MSPEERRTSSRTPLWVLGGVMVAVLLALLTVATVDDSTKERDNEVRRCVVFEMQGGAGAIEAELRCSR